MVAILVDSRRDGKTAWVATRGLEQAKVEGLAGCRVAVTCKPSMKEYEWEEDCEFDLPDGTEFVMVQHLNANKNSRVFVDLI